MDNSKARIIRSGVLGANGTTGTELAKLLWCHPQVEIAYLSSRSAAGKKLSEIDPSAPDIQLVNVLVDSPESAPALRTKTCDLNGRDFDPAEVDVVFSCLPHGASAATVDMLLARGLRVIDLSGDFRLADEALHQHVYGSLRNAGNAASRVYGLTEWAKADLPSAKLIANPGCYPTSVLMPLLPLFSGSKQIGELTKALSSVVINSVSGLSGAGRRANDKTHFCSAYGDVRPYLIGRGHRHLVEIEASTLEICGSPSLPQMVFNPHLVPLERGMLSTITLTFKERASVDGNSSKSFSSDASTAAAASIYEAICAAYADAHFVNVLPFAHGTGGQTARVRSAAGNNRVEISVHAASTFANPIGQDHSSASDASKGAYSVVICSAIDNLLKGAAGQAVQNMNLMFGMSEQVGLPR